MSLPGRPEAVLFDAGGTLVHMSPRAVGDLIEPVAGVRPDPDRMVEAHYVAMHALSARPDVARASHPVMWSFWISTYLAAAGLPSGPEVVEVLAGASGLWTRPIPGAADAMRALRAARCRVAVVSNSDGTVRRSLGRAGFDGTHEFVVDSAEEGVSKPDPEIFRRALARIGVPGERTWYVGDSPFHDVEGGVAAGLAAVVLVDPLDQAPDHQPRVASVAELPGLLDRITS